MSPRRAEPTVQVALVDAAARVVATEGSDGLTLRRLADEVGTSTMAVYTHFGGMDEVRRAVRREGFARLAEDLDAVEQSDDPVADLILLGLAYFDNATSNRFMYRAMFMEQPLDGADAATGLKTFARMTDTLARCTAAGRFTPGDPAVRANQSWAMVHGFSGLVLVNLLTHDEGLAALAESGRQLPIGFGDDPDDYERSLATALERAGLA